MNAIKEISFEDFSIPDQEQLKAYHQKIPSFNNLKLNIEIISQLAKTEEQQQIYDTAPKDSVESSDAIYIYSWYKWGLGYCYEEQNKRDPALKPTTKQNILPKQGLSF